METSQNVWTLIIENGIIFILIVLVLFKIATTVNK